MVLKEMEAMGFKAEIKIHVQLVFYLSTELCVSHSINICADVIDATASCICSRLH